MTTPAIQFRAASKAYRDFFLRSRLPSLNHFSLDVAPGEIVGLLGPNGSGKSTAMKLAAGLLRPSGGDVRLNDLDPRVPSARNGLGYLPEENANYPFLSGERMVRFHCRLAGLSRGDAKKQTADLLEKVGLLTAAKRLSGTYSKGMARRLGLAQCLAGDPRILILDEPTSGLDPVATEMVRTLLQQLRKKGVTVLLSSHLLAEIEDVCDRVVVLDRGRIITSGTTADLLAVRGETLLRLNTADPGVLSAIREAVRQRGGTITEERRPTRTLSQFYRDIVKRPEE
jgi:ABC-2 type transport system ATP-binding protein